MRKILATNLEKSQETAREELAKIIKGMIVTRFIKKTYDITDTLLLYVPFALLEYEVKNTGKTKKAKRMQHIFLTMELGTGVVKPFGTLEGFECQEIEIEDKKVAYQEPDIDSIVEKCRRELIFKVLPKELRAFREYDIELIECKIIYRPLWIMRYKLFGSKKHIYKVYGDYYNM